MRWQCMDKVHGPSGYQGQAIEIITDFLSSGQHRSQHKNSSDWISERNQGNNFSTLVNDKTGEKLFPVWAHPKYTLWWCHATHFLPSKPLNWRHFYLSRVIRDVIQLTNCNIGSLKHFFQFLFREGMEKGIEGGEGERIGGTEWDGNGIHIMETLFSLCV